MSEALNQLLIAQLNQEQTDRTLWIIDENLSSVELNAILPRSTLSAITNRFDAAAALTAAGFTVQLNDFDFSSLASGSVTRVIYRVSKERALVHHCVNEAHRVLQIGGELIMLGAKQDGLQTNARNAARAYKSKAAIRKEGVFYRASIPRVQDSLPESLDSSDYSQLRMVQPGRPNAQDESAGYASLRFLSKPGIFGWNKIDRGSALLAREARVFLDRGPTEEEPEGQDLQDLNVLDLGCGYGFLTLALKDLPFGSRTATDNNTAAVTAARANFEHLGLDVCVTLDDCGEHLDRQFELILCNPPFHLGFNASRALTEKFLSGMRRLLSPKGTALIVVNQFIPLERLAADHFALSAEICTTEGFRVLMLQLPKRQGRR